jgi:sarcosine oxidase
VLLPERCIELLLLQAERAGAHILFHAIANGWSHDGTAVIVATSAGNYSASRVILTAGPWLPELAGRMPLPLSLERQGQFWFAPETPAETFGPARLPVFLLEHRRGSLFYGIPDFGDGLKVAFHHGGESLALDRPRRPVDDREIAEARSMTNQWLAGAAGALRSAAACIYTNTPDGHFVIDHHPDAPGVLVASCCSGHGFKFATVIGEVLADLACDVPSPFDLAPFRAGRFDGPV